MPRNIVIKPLACLAVEKREFEICELKGIGHPDSIADGVCEAASRELSQAYLEQCGRVLHHNLDKGLLIAGRSMPRFEGGTLLSPIRIIICGRATHYTVDVQRIALGAASRYLAQNIRCADDCFRISAEISEGSENLKPVFGRQNFVANDTSFGTGFAPYSSLEMLVLTTSKLLTSSAFRQLFPAAGDDFKIMGHRSNGKVTLTIALALIDRHVRNVAHYFSIKSGILAHIQQTTLAQVRLNALDDPCARDESGIYLTTTGLSAEMGDDGQVGRGNRVSGLITPGRSMSLEAAAGKNPVAHVGKIYNVLAMLIARDIHDKVKEVDNVAVQLLSTIGDPIDRPQAAIVEVGSEGRLHPELHQKIFSITDEWLGRTDRVTDLILHQEVSIF